jgi:hypothetical protein
MKKLICPILLALGFAGCGNETNDVARCEQAAADLTEACRLETSDGRLCMSARYADYCADAPRPDLFADAIDCLNAHSQADACRTFGDPSAAADCVDAVYADEDDAAVDAFIADYAAAGGFADQPQRFMPPAYVLTPGQVERAHGCVRAGPDLSGIEACLAATVQAPLASCF